MSCDQTKMYIVVVLINNRLIMQSLLLLQQVLLGKGLHECQRLMGVPVLLSKSTTSWDPVSDVVLKTV